MYRGLWKIEDSFKLTKSELEARPVYVWTKEHIEAHFLTCFVALTLMRILEMKLENKYSSGPVSYTHLSSMITNLYMILPPLYQSYPSSSII